MVLKLQWSQESAQMHCWRTIGIYLQMTQVTDQSPFWELYSLCGIKFVAYILNSACCLWDWLQVSQPQLCSEISCNLGKTVFSTAYEQFLKKPLYSSMLTVTKRAKFKKNNLACQVVINYLINCCRQLFLFVSIFHFI